MIHGKTVSVSLRTFSGQDEYGNDIVEYGEPFDVDDVLVGKGGTVNRIEEGQPYAIEADRLFCFPKGYGEDMRGAHIAYDGKEYIVVGEPVDFPEENLPSLTRWNLKCQAVRFDG